MAEKAKDGRPPRTMPSASAADLLRQTLEEAQLTGAKLNELAKKYINQKTE